jgi:hypothetical protein
MTQVKFSRSSLACLLAIASLSAQVANAHNTTLPAVCTQPGVTVRTVGFFSLTGQNIMTIGSPSTLLPNGNVCFGANSCSVVDQWHFTRQQADRYCAELPESARAEYASAQVAGPSAYLSRDHHQIYTLSMGIYGQCRVCEKDAQSW